MEKSFRPSFNGGPVDNVIAEAETDALLAWVAPLVDGSDLHGISRGASHDQRAMRVVGAIDCNILGFCKSKSIDPVFFIARTLIFILEGVQDTHKCTSGGIIGGSEGRVSWNRDA